jgi:hypothetical protein
MVALNRFGFTLADVEREYILETLACCHDNRTHAAKLLDISIRCLRMKLRAFDHSRGMVAEADMGLCRDGPACSDESSEPGRLLLCDVGARPSGIMVEVEIGTPEGTVPCRC